MKKSTQVEIKVKLNIDEKELSSIFDGAFYGMKYWAKGMYPKSYGELDKADLEKEKIYTCEQYAAIILNGGSLLVVENTENKEYEINLDKIVSGLEILSLKYPHLINLSDIESMDSNSSECLVQCAIFNEIIYG